jgi:centromere protein I
LEEIDGVVDFVERLDKIEPPSQMVSTLDDPLLLKYLYLKDDDVLRGRLDTWLSFYLESQLPDITDGEAEDKTFSEVLQKMLHYVRATKSLPSSMLSFLHRLVNQWDGRLYQKVILELFASVPRQPFDGEHLLPPT